MEEKRRKAKAVVVGGSIAGISAAHSLLIAGWDVVVLEKTFAPPTGSPTGAGLGLDPLAQKIIESWIGQPNLLYKSTLPLTVDQVRQFPHFVISFRFPSFYFLPFVFYAFLEESYFMMNCFNCFCDRNLLFFFSFFFSFKSLGFG